ncbi:MAG TPA: monofunctional biosynthetic peptidoglycan transglycosylase [Prolixibacteraceae bacterium]|nr:monofunctional biosynthetic peptidoglycan transglycosylase [Prolixibacteraceae bacterium]
MILLRKKRNKDSEKKRSLFQKITTVVKWCVIAFFASTLLFVVLYRFVNPPITTFMAYQTTSRLIKGQNARFEKKWVPIENISPKMIRAVIAAEDNRFVNHWGIDTKAIDEAIEHNKRGKNTHGASTISQQTAKNVFLWPSRNIIRKGLEFYFTLLIEWIWGKQRIMEVYLNVVETGKNFYGVEKAAQNYFHTSCSGLTDSQAALIAATLPSPQRYNPVNPGNYLASRRDQIVSLMYKIETLTVK